MNVQRLRIAFATALLMVAVTGARAADAFDTELLGIQQAWAIANYSTAGKDAQVTALESLATRAASFVNANPKRAEPLIWQGIVLSTTAGVKGGLGALGLARRARDSLNAALALNPQALDGSAYTSLGTLYYKVPGFPLGFGDHDKARKLLQEALALNPDGIDSNYFYGEFLFEDHRFAEAAQYLQKALAAPPRPNRELADAGRRKEIDALLARVRSQMTARSS